MIAIEKTTEAKTRISILGVGNIGLALVDGLIAHGKYRPEQFVLTRRQTFLLDQYKQRSCTVTSDNKLAVQNSALVIVAVRPQQVKGLLEEISSTLIPQLKLVFTGTRRF